MKATGRQILKLAEQHLGQKYIFGAFAPKNNPNWRGPWDCAEFCSWCVYQAAGILYGCASNRGNPALADAYTGYWGRDVEKLGKAISPAAAARIPGAMVLRLGTKIGHIVISDGLGGTVEAHSTATGVIRNTLSGRRWTTGILVPGIEYEAPVETATAQAEPLVFRLASPLMRGEVVGQIQTALRKYGYDPGPVDSIFGPKVHAAVLQYQQQRGLVCDGEVGPQTAEALGIELAWRQ